MLLEEWRKFKGWEVLEFFLRNDRKIHLRGLSKELKISPRTAQLYLHLYESEGLVRKEKAGNMIFYELNANPMVFEFKRLYFLLQIYSHMKNFSEENPEINTLALYGSHASGEYDSKSDIDLLAISQNKRLSLRPLGMLEKNTGKEVKMHVFSIGEWKGLIKKSDTFALSVLKNHILLHGASL